MADYTALAGRPDEYTFTAGAAITAGQVLVFSGSDEVSPSSVASTAFAGIAAHDAAHGSPVTVVSGAGCLHETASTAAQVLAGALLAADADGAVVSGATAGAELGVAVRSTGAQGGTVRWKQTIG